MMLEGVAIRTFVPLLLRAALAAVFIYHGLDKIRPDTSYGVKWDLREAPLPTGVQIMVAWGELLCGVGVALGLFTRIAAAGIIVIMLGAIVTVTGQKGFGAPGGFEFNYVLILVAAALALSGAGTLSLDRVIRVEMRGPAQY